MLKSFVGSVLGFNVYLATKRSIVALEKQIFEENKKNKEKGYGNYSLLLT
jgi:hypothetical protein